MIVLQSAAGVEEDDPLVRSMKIQALAIAAQCWNHESIKQYDETVTNVGAMLDTARPAEERERFRRRHARRLAASRRRGREQGAVTPPAGVS